MNDFLVTTRRDSNQFFGTKFDLVQNTFSTKYDIFGPKNEFLVEFLKNRSNSSLLSPLGSLFATGVTTIKNNPLIK